MSLKLNFTQALALRPWYEPTDESVELLKELDKDLKKWDAHVSEESNTDQVCSVIDAVFDHVRYRFTLRLHAPVEIIPIDTACMPVPYRGILKLHLRARNVLKNFLPVVFDRLSAERQLQLVSLYAADQGPASHCIWVTNSGGLGISVVTMVAPEEALHEWATPPLPAAPAQEEQSMDRSMEREVAIQS